MIEKCIFNGVNNTEDVVIKSETTIGERIGTGIQTASAIGFNVGGAMIGTAINKLMKDDDYRDE